MYRNTKIDYDKINEYVYYLRSRDGKRSKSTQTCCGNIWQQIHDYRRNLRKMCLVGVSNETHFIESVVNDATDEVLYDIKTPTADDYDELCEVVNNFYKTFDLEVIEND